MVIIELVYRAASSEPIHNAEEFGSAGSSISKHKFVALLRVFSMAEAAIAAFPSVIGV